VTYTFQGIDYDFKIRGDGHVVDMEGNVICETGGEACLDIWWAAWVESNSVTYTQMTFTINKVSYTFSISSSGKVTDADGNVICETGGEACLQEWVTINQVQEISVTLNGHHRHFYLKHSGEVTDSEGFVVCATGGMDCLNAWISS
jgi:hypothetical protein